MPSRAGWRTAALVLLLTITSASAALAAPAPRVTSVAGLAQLRPPLPLPYDEGADAQADLAAARARAKAGGKRLLIDLGGNWCGDCRILSAVMALPEVARFIDEHYVVVTVDVGRFERNMDIPAEYGVRELEGVPTLLVVDASGRVLNRRHLDDVTAEQNMTPQGIADWLARWAG